tara:strand:- start:293 stop:757 length:465 start_codon:yes stop_codon:yes gene_type:complete
MNYDDAPSGRGYPIGRPAPAQIPAITGDILYAPRMSKGDPQIRAVRGFLGKKVFLPLAAVPMALSDCHDLGCLGPVFVGGPVAVLGLYPLMAKLVAPKASYGKRLLGSAAVAVVAGNIILPLWKESQDRRREAKRRAGREESERRWAALRTQRR